MSKFFRLVLLSGLLAWPSFVSAQHARKAQRLSRWHVPPANYSAICHLAADTFALVDDKSPHEGYYPIILRLHPRTGKITEARLLPFRPSSSPANHAPSPDADLEGIAYVPTTQRLYIASEARHAVGEYTIDGRATGRALSLPPIFNQKNITANASFEALCYDPSAGRLWLTTEQPLHSDGGIHRLQSFGTDLRPGAAYAYQAGAPRMKVRPHYAYGISAMTALSDGRLLVMEREASIPSKGIGAACHVRIYAVRPTHAPSMNGDDITKATTLSKTLIYKCTTRISPLKLNFANYEGMCPGPRLNDGRQTLLLISDSQAGAGNSLYHLRDYIRVIIIDS